MIFHAELDVAVHDKLDIPQVPWSHDVASLREEVLAVPGVEEVFNAAGGGNDFFVHKEFCSPCTKRNGEATTHTTTHESEDPPE